MRKITIVMLLALVAPGLLASPVTAGKKKRPPKPRKIELSYAAPAYGTAGAGVCFQGESCLFFGPPVKKERFFSVEIVDDLGTAVYASVIQDTNEDGNYLATDDLTVPICGETEEPIEIERAKPVSVWVWQGPGADAACPGGASSGTATATFSSK